MRIITLTTDFGTRDWFVGTMKGVILGIAPRAQVVDITHEVPPGDIRAGAFALMAACRYFPKGTVHVAVVDPGVGSQRQAIAVQTANGTFIGPDNGVLSWALMREKIKTIRLLENQKYFLKERSHTFHGRDIFAPVAAHVSRGLPVQRLGRELKDFQRLPWPTPVKGAPSSVSARPRVLKRAQTEDLGTPVQGEIIHIDRFGNAITNIEAGLLPGDDKATREVTIKRKLCCKLAECYSAVPAGSPVAVIGSSGFLEIAVNGGSAERKFGLEIGDKVVVTVRFSPA